MPTLIEGDEHIHREKWMTAEEKATGGRADAYTVRFINDRRQKTTLNPQWGSRATESPGGKIVMIEAGTGSGKSTVLPAAVFADYSQKIVCTQPRTLTAISIPKDVALYTDLKISKNLGWVTGKNKQRTSDRNSIMYMTAGSLFMGIQRNGIETLLRYDTIFIDEVHDRSIEADKLKSVLKHFLQEYYEDPKCPIIVFMSATFNAAELALYYGIPEQNYLRIGGRSFPIERNFASTTPNDYTRYVCELVKGIHLGKGPLGKPDDLPNVENDILIFVSGGTAATEIIKQLEIMNLTMLTNNEKSYLLMIKLSSGGFRLGGADYNRLTSKNKDLVVTISSPTGPVLKPCGRKVIISTNVAETGITIEGLRYVIDTGKAISSTYDVFTDSTIIMERPVTKDESKQRQGRVGRLFPGVSYLCYTEDTYNEMADNPLPSILTTDCSMMMLSLIVDETKSIEILEQNAEFSEFSVKSHAYISKGVSKVIVGNPFRLDVLDLLTWPSADALSMAFRKLQKLGFISSNLHVTPMGYIALTFGKSSPEDIRSILGAYAWGAQISDVVTVVAMLEKLKMRLPTHVYAHKYGTIGVFLGIYDEYLDTCEKSALGDDPSSGVQRWAKKYGTNIMDWSSVVDRRVELLNELESINMRTYDVIETSNRPYHDRMRSLQNSFKDGYSTRQAKIISEGNWSLNDVPVSSDWRITENPICMALITRNTGGKYTTEVSYAI